MGHCFKKSKVAVLGLEPGLLKRGDDSETELQQHSRAEDVAIASTAACCELKHSRNTFGTSDFAAFLIRKSFLELSPRTFV